MKLFKKIPWEHGNKNYEIRILSENNLINILAFYNNYPANGFRYQIQLAHDAEIQKFLKIENFEHLIENLKDDIRNERWLTFTSH